jgi:hypothetical protein
MRDDAHEHEEATFVQDVIEDVEQVVADAFGGATGGWRRYFHW